MTKGVDVVVACGLISLDKLLSVNTQYEDYGRYDFGSTPGLVAIRRRAGSTWSAVRGDQPDRTKRFLQRLWMAWMA
jgi:hypothetical protein